MSCPNILFLFSDQHRGDWLSCAGHPYALTPNLDRLAAAGTRFTQAYCNYPLCGPSRMSVMTGRHPFRNNITVNEHCLPSDTPTIAHALALAGYETILAGRMHFCGPDQRHGFQQRYVGDLNAHMAGGPSAMGEGPMRAAANNAAGAAAHCGTGECPGLRFDEHVTQACEHVLTQRSTQKPLFLTAGFFFPHHPFFVPESYYEAALARLPADDAPRPPLEPGQGHPFDERQRPFVTVPDLTPQKRRHLRALYAAMITWLDERIGRVLEAAARLPGETLVLYSSDHGEFACDYDRIGKLAFHEPAIHVPLIGARFRDGEALGPRGQTVSVPVSLVDVAPTFVEASGAPPPPLLDGDSLLELLDDGSRAREPRWRERAVFSELCIRHGKLDYPPSRMVRRGRHKLHFHHGMPPRLFDLAEDPLERNDLAANKAFASLRGELEALIHDGWDPERIARDAASRSGDMAYLRQWGALGLGPSGELFDPSRNPTKPL
jgi:choline-sulfatase